MDGKKLNDMSHLLKPKATLTAKGGNFTGKTFAKSAPSSKKEVKFDKPFVKKRPPKDFSKVIFKKSHEKYRNMLKIYKFFTNHFPLAFPQFALPLKVGIHKDIIEYVTNLRKLPAEETAKLNDFIPSDDEIKLFLSFYGKMPFYYFAVLTKKFRIGIRGEQYPRDEFSKNEFMEKAKHLLKAKKPLHAYKKNSQKKPFEVKPKKPFSPAFPRYSQSRF